MRRFFPALSLLAFTALAAGQTNSDLVLKPWDAQQWGDTTDKVLYQDQGHVKDGSGNTQIFWWDSIGRFRFGTAGEHTPTIGYRYVTLNFDTHSPSLPEHLDKLSVAGGFHLGGFAGGDLGIVAGAGWSGDNPFADDNGLFGIGHLLWQRKYNQHDALVLSIDYDGGSAFLSDIPLPGFQLVHRGPTLSYGFGFPRSFAQWSPTEKITLTVQYDVPYTVDCYADLKISEHFSVFGNFANFFESFQLDDQARTDRLLQQMSRVEMGVRYSNKNFFSGLSFDAALAVGYAFHQKLYHGWDVRDLNETAEISDEPYIALTLRGTF